MATDADAQAYIDEVETQTGQTYPAKYDAAIDQLVQDLKTAGAWAKMDILYAVANHSRIAAEINIKSPANFRQTYPASQVPFTQDVGFVGDGTNATNTNWTPSTDGVNYTLNSASFGFWTPTANNDNSEIETGVFATEAAYKFRADRVRINGGEFRPTSPGTYEGLSHVNRTDSTTIQWYINGVLHASSGSNSSTSVPTGDVFIMSRNFSGSISLPTTKTVSMVWWGGDLSAEAGDIHTAFDDYLTAIEASATVLTAEQGSYTVTGQVANLLYHRVLTADQGTFTVTGQDAILSLIYLLTAESGSYTITGAAAEFLENYILNAEQGTYTITGQDVNLLKNYALLAEQGSYAVSGQDANFLRSLILAAEQGSYTVTGFDTSIFKGLRITLESGNYAITGNDVDLLRSLVLQAQSGSYTLTGQQADLIRNLILSAEQGTYTVTGQDVELITQNSPEILTLLSTISTTLDLDSKV